jgi:hypothetical protein
MPNSAYWIGGTTHYVGSYGDSVNNLLDQYGGNNARVNFGAGGCASTFLATPPPPPATAACPRPTTKFGGGPNHRGFFEFSGMTKPVGMENVLDGLTNTIMIGHTGTKLAENQLWFTAPGSLHGTSQPINHKVTSERRGFSSYHDGGTFSCMGDGSVRFFSERISSFTHNALGSRAGGEPIGAL